MTRRTTSAAIGQKSAIPQQQSDRVLFEYGDWIGLKANNQWGFDIVSLGGKQYHQSLLETQDFNTLMQCFAAALKQYGILNLSQGGIPQRAGSATGGIVRRRVSRNNGVAPVTSNTTSSVGTGTGTGARGTNTRSRVNRVNSQTPVASGTGSLATSGT